MRLIDKALHVVIAIPAVLLVVLTTAVTIVGSGLLFALVRGFDVATAWLKRLGPLGERPRQRRTVRAPTERFPSRRDRR